jgi:hypothetical protein
MQRGNRLGGIALGILVALFAFAGSAAASSTIYLRPDVDKGTCCGSAVGTSTLWDSINDDLTEADTPTGGNYLTILPTGPRQVDVELDSTAIPSGSTLNATAWIYTANAAPVGLRVSSGPTFLTGTVEFSTPGWHSIPVPLSGAQSQVDRLIFKISVPSGSGAGTVNAAFLRLSISGPSPKVYWGARMDGDVYHNENPLLKDAPWDGETWRLFESHARKPASIIHFGQPVPWEQAFTAEPFEAARKGGSIPLLSMGTGRIPGRSGNPGHETVAEEEENLVSLSEISAGKYDSYIEGWAKSVAEYGHPFFFRWAWEMNGAWFKWGRDARSNPADYVLAWRHIHNIAEAAGASNITWVWCPNVNTLNSPLSAALYPGSAYVDWTCLDGYNQGGSNWRSFGELFGSSYTALLSIAPTKPVMIGETASAEGSFLAGPAEYGKRTWITEALADEVPSTYPQIKAFLWFNWNIVEHEIERTWPIETSDGAQTAFAAGIGSPYYAADAFENLPLLTKIAPLP